MSQKWEPAEHEIRVDVEPGASANATVIIPHEGRPFRILSVVATADGENFRLVQCHVGSKRIFKNDGDDAVSMFPAGGLFGTAEPGTAITVRVKNVSAKKCAFVAKVVGEALVLR